MKISLPVKWVNKYWFLIVNISAYTSIRIETCANMQQQMQIFYFSLTADYTCKLVNTQISIIYIHIIEFRHLLSLVSN